jgi:hypothetical protein
MKKPVTISLIITLFFVLIGGCSKKEDAPPALPSSKSLSIDFSNFKIANKSADINSMLSEAAAVTNVNWMLAVTTATVWNTLLTVTLAVPVAAFGKAMENTPVYIQNKTWEWKYSVNALAGTYNATLTGQIKTDSIRWEMYISRDGVGSFAEFLWFSGRSALDGKSGQWVLNHGPLFQEPLLQIDWQLNGTEVGNIKYTYIRDRKDDRTTDFFKTSYIEYGLNSTALNAFYNVRFNNSTTTSDFKTVNIEWNTTNHNGHIKASHYYQDSNWHCWDNTGNDVTCN